MKTVGGIEIVGGMKIGKGGRVGGGHQSLRRCPGPILQNAQTTTSSFILHQISFLNTQARLIINSAKFCNKPIKMWCYTLPNITFGRFQYKKSPFLIEFCGPRCIYPTRPSDMWYVNRHGAKKIAKKWRKGQCWENIYMWWLG